MCTSSGPRHYTAELISFARKLVNSSGPFSMHGSMPGFGGLYGLPATDFNGSMMRSLVILIFIGVAMKISDINSSLIYLLSSSDFSGSSCVS